MRGGPHIVFHTPHANLLRAQWSSDKVSAWLRSVLVTAAMLYDEQGAPHMTILSLLGNTEEERVGRTAASSGYGADISVYGLPTALASRLKDSPDPLAAWIVERLNLIYPHEGPLSTATYEDDFERIRIRVPANGYKNFALSLFLEWGPIAGRALGPRKVRE